MTENSIKKQRKRGPGRPFKKGQSGNPSGKPRGAKNHATRLAQMLLDGQMEAIVNKAVTLALQGDSTALRVCMERLLPARRDLPIEIDLPEVRGAADLPKVTGAILVATAKGDLTPHEASTITKVVTDHGKALELAELEARIAELEKTMKKD